MKALVIIDMQNDFVTGALANPAAQAIVEPMKEFIEQYDGELVFFTKDSHNADSYLATQEGKKLPVPHCIWNTDGWEVVKELSLAALNNKRIKHIRTIHKPTFGFGSGIKYAFDEFDTEMLTEITVVGTCTDICVVSNVLALKELFPEVTIKVIGSLCAGLTEKKHKAALEVMRSCQVEVE